MSLPNGILMVSPEYFDIVDVKNPYMNEQMGNIQSEFAQLQWNNLHTAFSKWKKEGIIRDLIVMKSESGFEDMVFCANPFMMWTRENGTPMVLLSNMLFDSRQSEVDVFEKYFEHQSIPTYKLPTEIKIEGNGDLIPQPSRRLLWMGHGFRTDFQAAKYLSENLKTHIIPLKLVSEHFYHLDTCFCIIDEENVAICKEAFDEESYMKIKEIFPFVHEISLQEARNHFALNSIVMSKLSGDKYAILPKGCDEMKHILLGLNVNIQEVDTSEFIKSGGSIYCMKALLY